MSQPTLKQLVSKLNIRVRPKQMQFATPAGPAGRIKMMRKSVTALIQHERIELNFYKAHESRGYAERLISEAIRYGDCHRPTMNLAQFWLTDPALVPKLFKVIAPRFKNHPSGLSFTRMLRAPSNIKYHWNDHSSYQYDKAVLELRGNPYPPLPDVTNKSPNPSVIHNVLLEEARKDCFKFLSNSTLSDRNDSISEPANNRTDVSQIISSTLQKPNGY